MSIRIWPPTGTTGPSTPPYDIGFLAAAIRQKGLPAMCFGAEVPGSGTALRPETGLPGDDLVPVIDSLDWLTAADKDAIFHDNPLRFCEQSKRYI